VAEQQQKRTLWQQLVFLDTEITDIDVWESVYQKEGKPLPSGTAERRIMLRSLRSLVEVVYANEDAVRTLLRGKTRLPIAPPPPQAPPPAADDAPEDQASD
jgi:hypothetical protein